MPKTAVSSCDLIGALLLLVSYFELTPYSRLAFAWPVMGKHDVMLETGSK